MKTITSILIFLAVLGLFLKPKKKKQERKKDYDDDFRAEDDFSRFNKGFWVGEGRTTRESAFKHCSVIAPSGAGKSTTVIIPTLLEVDDCSGICLDLSGELTEKTSGNFAKKGFNVMEINLLHPERSCGFNPLQLAETNTELNILVETLFAPALRSSKDTFWPQMAVQLTTLICKLQKRLPVQYQNLANTKFLVDALKGSRASIDMLFAKHADDKLFEEYKALATHESKMFSSIIATAQSSLWIFGDPTIARTTSHNTLNFETFRKEKTMLYIRVGVLETFTLPIIELLFTQFFRFCLSRIPNDDELDIFVFVDEAGSLTIKSFPEILSNARKHRVGVLYSIQNTQQLISRYNKQDATTILENSYHKVVFGGMEPSLAKDISERMGKWSFQRENGMQGQRELMSIAELIALDPDKAVYMAGSKRPSIITLKPYYESFSQNRKSQIPPPEPKGDTPEEVSYIELPKPKATNA